MTGWADPSMDVRQGGVDEPMPADWATYNDPGARGKLFIRFDGGECIGLTASEAMWLSSGRFQDAVWRASGELSTSEQIALAAWRRVLARRRAADPWAGYRTMWTAMAGQ